ncbi:MAG: Twin-arginine translocation pathway signal [Hyphomicrobiales bacterium]|nr:Twin-arginine translocation pathway signal [Hyphomicrobiales bacterium]
MRVMDKQMKVSRRGLLGATGASLVAMTVMPTGMIVGADSAWAAMAKNIKPETFATLVQMARDIYPHDKVSDKYYAMVVEGLDAGAGKADEDKALLEDGVAELNKAASGSYMQVGWEKDRVALLQAIESSGFFQKVRGSLVTGIYNNKDLWPLFGYEGESASKGGYIERGFDDIDWLDAV